MNNIQALSHLKVIDLSRVVSGPYSTMILADFGAEVLKIEIPDIGDDARSYGPHRNDESLYFANLNRNKKGMTLNLKSEEGKEIFKQLIKEADVVVENFRPGTMEKLGLGYLDLKKINPRLIYGALSGFGQEGTYSHKPGYDIIAQAMGGMMSITGQEGNPPTRAGNPNGDILGGLNLTIGILVALQAREKTGVGQMVDVSLTDSVIHSILNLFTSYHESQELPKRIGNRYEAVSPYDSFLVKDGHVIIACGNQSLFKKFCLYVLEQPDLIDDQRFKTNSDRVIHHQPLKEIIEEHFKNMTVSEVITINERYGIPCCPINNLEDIMSDDHFVKEREMFLNLDHPVIGEMIHSGTPIKLSDTKAHIDKVAPTLSQHTQEILLELGYSLDEIQQLKKEKII